MLLPSKFQPESLPSLGKLVAKAIAPKPVDPIEAFEIGDHTKTFFRENVKVDKWPKIRKSKGAAPESKSAYAGTLSRPASTDAASPSPQAEQPAPFKVGDRVRIVHSCRSHSYTGMIGVFDGMTSWDSHKVTLENGEVTTWYGASSLQLAPSQEADKGDAEGWIAWDWQNDDAPDIPECARVDLKVMCRGELVEYPRQLCGFAMSHEHFFITHYRLSK